MLLLAQFVKKISECGKELGRLSLPKDESKIAQPGGGGFDEVRELIVEYGTPVVAPNGDVYTWKRTPDKYSILKWTWVDDPNVPTGPDAPSGLAVIPSIDGLYLTWTASPNDPGCVTKYEIARATTSGGVFSAVGTVGRGYSSITIRALNVTTVKEFVKLCRQNGIRIGNARASFILKKCGVKIRKGRRND